MTVPNSPSVRRRVAVGATFMVLLRISFRLIGLLNTLILVRLLLPSDFGLVGLATLAYSVFDTLSGLSFELAIIRMEKPQRIHYDTAWSLGVIRGAVIAVLLVASSPLLADFIGDPRVITLSYVLAGLGLLQGCENVALVDFQRSLRFGPIFWYQIVGKVAGVLVAIPVAFLLRNYWALIYGMIAARIAMLLTGYIMKPYRPNFSFAGWWDLFHFSKWLMATNFLTVIDQYCMTLTVGRIAGTPAIGIFQVANQIGSLPASEIAAPIRDPIYAGYTRVADNLELLRKHFLSNLSLLIAVITPLSLGIFIMADPIATLFLGQKWIAAVPLIRWTALYALFDAIAHSAGSVYMTLHRQRRWVGLYVFVLSIRVPAIIIGAYYDGIRGAAAALVLSAALNMALWNGLVPAELGVRARDFWVASWRTVFASAVMLLSVAALLQFWRAPLDTLPAICRFGVICFAGGVIHVFTQYTAWRFSDCPATVEADILQIARTAQQRFLAVMRRAFASAI